MLTHIIYLKILSSINSINIATGYGLDSEGSSVHFLAGAGNFSLLHCIQICSGAHPYSYPTGTRVSFPRDKLAIT